MKLLKLAAKWGVVPAYEAPAAVQADWLAHQEARKKNEDVFRERVGAVALAFEKKLRAMRRPPKPGLRPAKLTPPPFPDVTGDDAKDRAEAKRWALEVNEPWLDEVFWPHEVERVLWQIAANVRSEWEAARNARRLERADWIRSWAPLVLYVGGGVGAFVAAFVFAWANC